MVCYLYRNGKLFLAGIIGRFRIGLFFSKNQFIPLLCLLHWKKKGGGGLGGALGLASSLVLILAEVEEVFLPDLI
jgi:hypothetical protein